MLDLGVTRKKKSFFLSLSSWSHALSPSPPSTARTRAEQEPDGPSQHRNRQVDLMAATGCSHIRFFSTTETAFYFEAADNTSDLVDDAFRKSCIPNKQCFIRSADNKFVILDADGQLKATNLTEAQLQSDCKFNIQFYKDNNLRGDKRRAVMLYVKKDGKTMVACCNEKNEICPEEMDIPQRIDQSQHRAVFYQRELSSCKYSLESSLYPARFMAFEPNQTSTLYKLVLRPKARDEVDESSEVMLI